MSVRALLEANRDELETAVFHRVRAISDPGDADAIYVESLRVAVSVSIDYAFAAIERGEHRVPPPPPALLAQARLAARNGIPLETVLRRYLAGYALLGDLLTRKAEQGRLPDGTSVARLLPSLAAVLDRLLAAVAAEYVSESKLRPDSTEERRAERVGRLLAGETIDTQEFPYDFSGWHVGLVASPGSAAEAIGDLAAVLDCVLLKVRHADSVWAWLGSRRGLDPGALARQLCEFALPEQALAIGEPGSGLAGWRLSHRQAAAALPVALRRSSAVVRYADVAQLASVIQDDLLVAWLRATYLAPLDAERDGGTALRETLLAYFRAQRNVSSAAAALGVSRNTVAGRLAAVEQVLGESLWSCASELEAALDLEELGPLTETAVIEQFAAGPRQG